MNDIRRDRDYLDDDAILEYLNNFGENLVSARPARAARPMPISSSSPCAIR
jgi:predicted Zn-dependent protease